MVRPSVPDPPELEYMLWRGFTGREGWDVGANCGQTALVMAWSFTHVTSFEPSPASFAYARDLVASHGIAADVLNLALSDSEGLLTLAYPAQEQKDTGQLVTVGTAGMEWEPDDWGAVEKVTVACRTADSLAKERGYPDFMKVDTEGHEVKVLRGAAAITGRGRTDFLVEFHTPENSALCTAMLQAKGYDVEVVRHPHYQPESSMWFQHGWLRALAPKG